MIMTRYLLRNKWQQENRVSNTYINDDYAMQML